jgi:hypothetical protein
MIRLTADLLGVGFHDPPASGRLLLFDRENYTVSLLLLRAVTTPTATKLQTIASVPTQQTSQLKRQGSASAWRYENEKYVIKSC